MTSRSTTLVATVSFAVTLVATPAFAAYFTQMAINKCLSGKLKATSKGSAGAAVCRAKNVAHPDADALATCTGKNDTKLTTAFERLDARGSCLTTGDGPTVDGAVDSFALDDETLVGGPTSKCNSAKQRAVATYVGAIAGCYAKAANKGGAVSTGTPKTCTDRARARLMAVINQAETFLPNCTHTGQGPTILAFADLYLRERVCVLDSSNPQCVPGECNDGILDPGEQCDPSGGPATSCPTVSNTSAAFGCNPLTCTCECPGHVTLTANAADPATAVDVGWTGIGHRMPLTSDPTLTLAVTDCSGFGRPCGTCTTVGPVPNPSAGAGQLDSQRCSTDPSKRCATAADCARHCVGGSNEAAVCSTDSECPTGACAPVGTCEYHLGPPLPLVAGLSFCAASRIAGPVVGTMDIESGAAATALSVVSTLYLGNSIDAPCPRCVGDPTPNDGVLDGSCDAGLRLGHLCDANAAIPARPDFGMVSLDCQPIPGVLVTSSRADFTLATASVTRTVTAASPACTGPGDSADRCLCETCNSAAAEPCSSNADCPMSGGQPGVCGGRRCVGGINHGLPCSTGSQCPAGNCGRTGELTRTSGCQDDTTTVGIFDCSDTSPVDGEGECLKGPSDSSCSLASGHAQRGCITDLDCGGGAGTCVAANRRCFLTGSASGIGKVGTTTLVADGTVDPPLHDVASPTLGAVFCQAPTTASVVNVLFGLPGPGRVTLKTTVVATP